MSRNLLISIIIPNYNGGSTLHRCLGAATSLDDANYEIIVVDDGSTDDSVCIIEEYPCRLVQLEQHSGTSRARNVGAQTSHGELLFFTDSDCVLPTDILARVRESIERHGAETILGGTYTPRPYDNRFFSRFQSAFIHYSETRHNDSPDYLASHAMVISNKTFHDSGGFAENFLPILEDVEFSHRLRQRGYRLYIEPTFQVQHIFDYSLPGSLRNAFRKSRYWVMYSLQHKDILADSGTASHGIKINVACFFLTLCLLLLMTIPEGLYGILVIQAVNLLLNRKLLRLFYDANGLLFSIGAFLYYFLVYPVPIGAGIATGVMQYITGGTLIENNRKLLE